MATVTARAPTAAHAASAVVFKIFALITPRTPRSLTRGRTCARTGQSESPDPYFSGLLRLLRRVFTRLLVQPADGLLLAGEHPGLAVPGDAHQEVGGHPHQRVVGHHGSPG